MTRVSLFLGPCLDRLGTRLRIAAAILAGTTAGIVSGHAQTLPGTPSIDTSVDVVVARFHVDIDGLESEFPDDAKAGGLVPQAIRGVQTARLAREAVQTLRTPDGTPVKIALDSLYAIVEAGLQRLGLHTFPSDTLRGTVPYILGFPSGTAKPLLAESRFTRAVEIEIDVTVPDQGTGYFALLGTGTSRTKGRPEMYLRVRYVDASGQAWREKIRVRSKEKVHLDEKWVFGVRTRTGRPESSTLLSLTQQAVDQLVARRLNV